MTLHRYVVFTREGNELMVLKSFKDREEAVRYMRTRPEGTILSLASLLHLDKAVRSPLRNRESNILEGGISFITRNRPSKSEGRGATKKEGNE